MFPQETDEHYELWGGEKMMMTPSNSEHGFIISNLIILVGSYVRQRQLGKVFHAEVPIYLHGDLTNKEFRLADFSFVSSDRLDIVQYKGIFGPPDLTVEVLSPGKTNMDGDRIEKYRLYETFGVAEYWVVDPFAQQINIYTLDAGKYVPADASCLFSGISLAHEDIFE